MKDHCSLEGCREIKQKIVAKVKAFAGKRDSVVLLSGGVDSAAVLFAVIDAGLPYSVINFKFDGIDSIDTNSVRQLQEKVGFNAEYLELEPFNEGDIKEAVRICKKTFGRVREVKCETIYAMLQVKKHIPTNVNIFCGYGGDDLFGYSRKDALLISRVGEYNDEVLKHRMLEPRLDEFRAAFDGMHYYSPYVDGDIQRLITGYTTKACNEKFPKSIIVRAFGEYFSKYKNARKPIGLHKGSCEQVMFEEIAKYKGFNSALAMFNHYAR